MQVKNVPTIDARYWTAIVAASMCGANMGDFVSRNLHLGHVRGLLPLAMLFSLVLWAERRAQRATEAYYWLAIIVLRTAATNLADLASHDLKLNYALIEGGLTAILVVAVLIGPIRGQAAGSGSQVDRQPRALPTTDAAYWVAMLTAGTLGTTSGDFVADNLELGVGLGSVVLDAVLAAVLLISARVGGMSKPWYWLSIVVARTAGTTMGDFLASRRGLDLGLLLSLVFTSLLFAGIVSLWRDKGNRRLRAPNALSG